MMENTWLDWAEVLPPVEPPIQIQPVFPHPQSRVTTSNIPARLRLRPRLYSIISITVCVSVCVRDSHGLLGEIELSGGLCLNSTAFVDSHYFWQIEITKLLNKHPIQSFAYITVMEREKCINKTKGSASTELLPPSSSSSSSRWGVAIKFSPHFVAVFT